MGADGLYSPDVTKGAGDYVEGFRVSSPVLSGAAYDAFVAKYKAAYGAVPDALATLGYDAAKVAFDAMERAKDMTGPSIREALEQTKGFQGVSGIITLDADHNAVKSAVVIKIAKNAGKFAAVVNP